MPWYKGNLHCHSNCSDGQLPPPSVAQYYKAIGHDFLGISDHNQYTNVAGWADAGQILGIPCCEYTGEDCCHIVSVGVDRPIAPNLNDEDIWKRCSADSELIVQAGDDIVKKKIYILQDGINKTNEAGGIPIIAHPFWHWSYNHIELINLKNCRHFEVCNASPDCNSIPLPGKSYPDELWDYLLTNGHRYFGTASDDAHIYMENYNPRSPFGGKAWNVVKAPELTRENILNGIRNGHFYASTGIVIREYKVSPRGINIAIEIQHDERVTIDFIGRDGRNLFSSHSPVAEYLFNWSEMYVRCRISSTAGVWAWTQPVFLDDLKEETIGWTQQ